MTEGGFDYQPTLAGTLLRVRPLRAGDFDALYAAAANPGSGSPDNVRSQRSVEKIGAVRFGTRPDAAGRESHAYRVEVGGLGAG